VILLPDAAQAKKEAKEKGGTLTGDVKRGFLTSGLWRYSRHPNFFCEQMVWWTVYAYGCASTGEWVHWTMVGPVLYTLLFQGSTPFTEWSEKSRIPLDVCSHMRPADHMYAHI
jgi:steroid 5-alpha reductase family enzyme